MKKTTALLLALLMALTALCFSPAMAETGFNADGIEAYPIYYKLRDGDGTDVALRVYMRVINKTSHPLWLKIDSAQADGVPVYGAGISGLDANSDTGNDSIEFFLFTPTDENDTAGAQALRKLGTLNLSIIAKDDSSLDELARQTVTLDLSGIGSNAPASSGGSSSDTSVKTDFGFGGGSTAPAYTPASYDFTTLKKGSKGQAVKDLQQRLTDLGFLNDKVDGSFGQNTATAVMSFCSQHGLYIQGEATPEMQQLLYSSSAQYYVEPWIPLVIGPNYKWKNPKKKSYNDIGEFYTQLVNRSHRKIRGYELYYYFTNMWGEKIYTDDGSAWLYPAPIQQTFESGTIQYCKPIMVYPFAYTYSVWVGVHKVVFDDGEIREADYDDIVFFECPVKK